MFWDGADQGLVAQQRFTIAHRFHVGHLIAGGALDNVFFLGQPRILDEGVHEEAILLRLGQGIGPFLVDRVLRGQDEKRRLQPIGLATCRHFLLLHRLEECRLRFGRRAVDLVGQQDVAEDRAGDEDHDALAGGVVLLDDVGADDVGRHQVGRELDALVLEPEHGAERFDEARLGEAGHADQQRVAAGEQRDESKVDDALLAKNNGGRRLAHFLDLGANFFDTVNELGLGLGKCCHGVSFARSCW